MNTKSSGNWGREMDAPPQCLLKLNFDGASRGNPGLGGAGGIFRNAQGEIISMYIVLLGQMTNNGVELEGLLAGLQWENLQGYTTIVAEGDSKLLVLALGKLINGTPPEKVSNHWRLSASLAEVAEIIEVHRRLSQATSGGGQCGSKLPHKRGGGVGPEGVPMELERRGYGRIQGKPDMP
jgi:ribonuclease HI